MRFDNKHVIITGGGTGIGRSTALQFAREGARVVVANRNRENGERVVEEISKTGGQAIYLPVDVADTTSVKHLVVRAVEANGPVHVAVSNAGVTESKVSALDNTEEDWDHAYNINARGSFMFCKACAENMIENEVQGAIVTVSSLVARGSKTTSGAYAASKAAVVMFTKTLAKTVAPNGIRVNCVSPGVVKTDIYDAVEEVFEMEKGSFADWLVEMSIDSGQLLIQRAGTSDEVAAAVLFLASSDASYITAQNLSVDGGVDWSW